MSSRLPVRYDKAEILSNKIFVNPWKHAQELIYFKDLFHWANMLGRGSRNYFQGSFYPGWKMNLRMVELIGGEKSLW